MGCDDDQTQREISLFVFSSDVDTIAVRSTELYLEKDERAGTPVVIGALITVDNEHEHKLIPIEIRVVRTDIKLVQPSHLTEL